MFWRSAEAARVTCFPPAQVLKTIPALVNYSQTTLSCIFYGVWTKCQPDEMPTGQNANLGWHFVRDFFSVVGILSGPTFWLAFCPDHLKMSWHPPPNVREWGGPVTSFCLLLTVVGKKVDNFLLLSWSGENFAVFDHHHLPWITLPSPHALPFCC